MDVYVKQNVAGAQTQAVDGLGLVPKAGTREERKDDVISVGGASIGAASSAEVSNARQTNLYSHADSWTVPTGMRRELVVGLSAKTKELEKE